MQDLDYKKKIIVGNLMYLFQNLTSSKNIDKDTGNLSNITKKLNTYVHNFFLKNSKYTSFHVPGIYTQISHVLDHKENLYFII